MWDFYAISLLFTIWNISNSNCCINNNNSEIAHVPAASFGFSFALSVFLTLMEIIVGDTSWSNEFTLVYVCALHFVDVTATSCLTLFSVNHFLFLWLKISKWFMDDNLYICSQRWANEERFDDGFRRPLQLDATKEYEASLLSMETYNTLFNITEKNDKFS